MEDFESIYKEYYDQIYRFLYLMNGADAAAAEELCEETFYQAFISFHRFRGDCKISTWLCQIAKNVSCGHFRHRRHETYIEEKELNISAGQISDPSYIAENAQTGTEIMNFIIKQKKKYRDILIYRLYHEMSFSEISKIMKMSEENARIIFHRARKKLMKQMEVTENGE